MRKYYLIFRIVCHFHVATPFQMGPSPRGFGCGVNKRYQQILHDSGEPAGHSWHRQPPLFWMTWSLEVKNTIWRSNHYFSTNPEGAPCQLRFFGPRFAVGRLRFGPRIMSIFPGSSGHSRYIRRACEQRNVFWQVYSHGTSAGVGSVQPIS